MSSDLSIVSRISSSRELDSSSCVHNLAEEYVYYAYVGLLTRSFVAFPLMFEIDNFTAKILIKACFPTDWFRRERVDYAKMNQLARLAKLPH